MEDNTSDYLTAYRKFFENFNSNVKLNDPMPVTTSFPKIDVFDVTGQVFDWCYRYLMAWDCPAALLVPLSRAVLEEVLPICKSDPDQLGFNPHENNFCALDLSKGVISHLVEVCQKYSDNAALSSLPSPGSESASPIAAFAGDRNGRRHMEDFHTSIHDVHKLFHVAEDLGEAGFYAIYDGHQGIRASQYCVAHLHENLVTSPNYPSDPVAAFEDAFLLTDKHFLSKKLTGGCTAVCLLHQRKQNVAYIAWAGDSLAVLSRSGIPVPLVQAHKPNLPEEKKRVEAAGGQVLKLFGVWRIGGVLAVSRAIGDMCLKDYVSAKPQVNKISLSRRDHFIILGSDGLWDFMAPESSVSLVYEHLGKGGDCRSASKALVERAAVNGSRDNISALVVLLCPSEDIVMDVMTEGTPVWARPEDLGPETVVDDDQIPASDDVDESHEVAEASESDEEWNFIPGSDNKENQPPSATEESVPASENVQGEIAEKEQVAEEDDMESGLNPDAAEFVPGRTETSEDSVVPESVVVANFVDDVIASSPVKGCERSLDDVVVPTEDEFDKDIASRPGEIDSDYIATNGKEIEVEEEDSNPFVANDDVDDVLSSPTTPPAGAVEFSTSERPPLAFNSDDCAQPPLAFQTFDNSQPMPSMSAEISSHFNFIDSHLTPEDEHVVEQQEESELDFGRLVLSKNHSTQETEENKIEEDAKESETLGKAEADVPADIMTTSFHEDITGRFDQEPLLSQKELLVGDEKHFMDKEEKPRPTSDLDSSFEVVPSKLDEPTDDHGESDDEVINHAINLTVLSKELSNLKLTDPLEENIDDIVNSSNQIEPSHVESHFTENVVESTFQNEVKQTESPFYSNLQNEEIKNQENEAISIENTELQCAPGNPFHEGNSFFQTKLNSQNPFETEHNILIEENKESKFATIQQDIFSVSEDLNTNEDHFGPTGLTRQFEQPAVQNTEIIMDFENEPIHSVELCPPVVESTTIENAVEEPKSVGLNDGICEPFMENEILMPVEGQIAEETPIAEEDLLIPVEPAAIVEETPLVVENFLKEEVKVEPEVLPVAEEPSILEDNVKDESAPTEAPICNGTSAHEQEVVEAASEQLAESVGEPASAVPVIAAATAVGAGLVAATAATAVVGKATINRGKVEAKPAAPASKASAKPAPKPAPAKPGTTIAAKKPASSASAKLAAKPQVTSVPAAKPKTSAKPAPKVSSTKTVTAKPSVGTTKPAAPAARNVAAKPTTAPLKPSVTAAKPSQRPASAAAKPATAKLSAVPATKPASTAAKPASLKPSLTSRPSSAKPAAPSAPKPALSKPSTQSATGVTARKPAVSSTKPSTAARVPSAKPAAAKATSVLTKTSVTKKATSTAGLSAGTKKPVPIKKAEPIKKVVNGSPHINLPEPVTSSNGHLESTPIATH